MATALACGALLPHPLVVGQAAPPPPPPPLPQVQPFQILTPPGLKTPTGPAIVPVVPNQIATPSPIPVVTFPTQTGPLTNLTWDSEQKEYNSKPGDLNANFTFWFTNTSSEEVIINAVRTSCGCTVAKLAATPWHLPPGTNGPIEVTVDLRGKSGAIAKAVTVESSAGIKSLIVKMNIAVGGVATDFTVTHPNMGDAERLKNMQDSLKDRQVVFKDAKCATCHADPAKGQVDGGVIYRGVCATCHDSQLRAAAVTDLKSLKHETDLDYWKMWISNGREGTMMPAYAEAHGGPLSETQINALALYCLNSFKPAAQNGATAPVPPSPAAAAPAAAPAAIATNAAVALPSVSIFPLPKSK
ncbi:MAG: hypothetical protein QOF48_3794 [Verrucomicrobiota bacterium]|jgi:cytochrome c553